MTQQQQEITFLAGEACLYSVTKRCAVSLGWRLIGEDASDKVKRNCHVIWIDRSFVNDKLFLSIQPWQRINHFPGMTNICRKARLAQSLELMRKKFPREYSFFPTTYVLPTNMAIFKTLFASNGQSKGTYIVKPDGSAQGKGIFLTRSIQDVENLSSICVAQQYIRNPLLIEKKKFDLRIYVLVTSCSPLRMYLFRDGLVRICTEEYKRPNSDNMDDRCVHLTNYSINKHSDKYERDDKGEAPSNLGSKRSIEWLLNWLKKEKGEAAANKMWIRVGDICVMTIMSILPILRREYASIFDKKKASSMQNNVKDETDTKDNYTSHDSGQSRCFEILGIDIMVNNDLRPSLIEVNHLPSWGTDSPIDEDIKSRVITQALSAINVNAHDRRKYQNAKRKQSQVRLGKKPPTTTCDVGDCSVEESGDNRGNNNQPSGGSSSTSRKSSIQPTLFDSNSAERRIRQIYEKHAPDKLPKVKELMGRYRGYEEWLAKKVEQKYNTDDSDSSSSSEDDDDEMSEDDDEESIEYTNERQRKRFEEEERILKDYDRIYPPSEHSNNISLSRYREMERYVCEMDDKQQRRLTCPLQQKRPNGGEVESEFSTHGHSNRGDGWIQGNIHIQKRQEEAKIWGPPTKAQVHSFDRLSRGYSVEDTNVSEKSIKKKSRIMHQGDFIYEEDNPFYHLIDRVRQSREMAKETRKKAEIKLINRAREGALLQQQELSLGLQIPLIVRNSGSKFYTKR